MALVFSALVFAFADLSLGVGLVQRAEITEADRSTVFWTSVALGVAARPSAAIAASGPLASFFGEPDVQPLFAVLSLSFVVGSLGATHAALLHRAMDFRSIRHSRRLLHACWRRCRRGARRGRIRRVVADCPAALHRSHRDGLLWLSIPWRPRLVFSLRSLRDLGSFGGRIFGVRIADYVRLNGDKLLIGRSLGSTSMGTYSVAFNILLAPVSRFLLAVRTRSSPLCHGSRTNRNEWHPCGCA